MKYEYKTEETKTVGIIFDITKTTLYANGSEVGEIRKYKDDYFEGKLYLSGTFINPPEFEDETADTLEEAYKKILGGYGYNGEEVTEYNPMKIGGRILTTTELLG